MPNSVETWNDKTLDFITHHPILNADPTLSSEVLAIESAAVFDAIAAIEGHGGIYTHVEGSGDVNAAVAAAAATVLNEAGAHIKVDTSDPGAAVGSEVARQIIDSHPDALDFTPPQNYTGSDEPGQWRPTPPNYLPGLEPEHGDVPPFIISDWHDHYNAPPAVGSPEYLAAVQQVQSLGAIDSTTRTPDQTEIAYFWSNDKGAYTPPGQLDDIAGKLAESHHFGLAETAALYAELNLAMADAGIAAWGAKYEDNLWRPITAIREGLGDKDWTPLLETPNHPETPSGHATFAGAAQAVLTDVFGDDVHIVATSPSLPGVVREFDSVHDLVQEDAISRIYASVHYEFSAENGLATGNSVGQEVLDKVKPVTDWVLSA